MFIVGLITGMIAGGMVSSVLICAVIAGSRAERSMEYEDMETGYRREYSGEAGEGENRNYIRFVDIFDHELFCIEDGECIELFAGDGEQKTYLCRYQDRRHASIDGKRWEMLNFARRMDRDGIIYIPAIGQMKEGGAA